MHAHLARVAKLADAGGLNPPSPQGSTGSNPVPGTATRNYSPNGAYGPAIIRVVMATHEFSLFDLADVVWRPSVMMG
jgi:hypothetical protein